MKPKKIVLGAGAAGAVAAGAVVARRRLRKAPLEELTKDELYERAKDAEIPGRSEMNKDELVRALRSAD